METAEGPRHIRTGKCTYVKMEVYAKNEKKTEIPRFSRKVTWDLRTPRKEGEDGRVGRQVSALAVPTGVLFPWSRPGGDARESSGKRTEGSKN